MAENLHIADMFPEPSVDNKVDTVLFLNGCKAMINFYGKNTI